MVPPATHRVAVADGTGPLAGTESQPSKLAEAVAAARDKCEPAPKSSENAYHKYRYASAEAIIGEATEAMKDTGLSLVPLSKRLRAVAVGTISYYELEQRFLLIHPSGESVPLEIVWPVVPDRGRPLDKAIATAATSSLAYLLRDLLLMPRVDPESEMDARADDCEPAAPASPPAKPAEKSSGTESEMREREGLISVEQHDELSKLIAESGTDHQRFCEHYHVAGVSMLPTQHFNAARGKLLAKLKPTAEQCDQIDALCTALKLDNIAAEKKLRDFMPSVRSFAELNRVQAGLLIDAMAKSAAVQGVK
jgi:hypothetical protein